MNGDEMKNIEKVFKIQVEHLKEIFVDRMEAHQKEFNVLAQAMAESFKANDTAHSDFRKAILLNKDDMTRLSTKSKIFFTLIMVGLATMVTVLITKIGGG